MAENMNKTDYAIQYAKKGLYVIPLRENSKIPTMKHKDQPALSADQLRLIFDQHPEFNIGVKTVDLFVIDVDSQQHGNGNVDGFASLKNIPEELLPPTLMETSPTGGKHYFYLKRNDEPSHNFIGWRKGIDVVAGKNNLTVVPPSAKNGEPYQWDNPQQAIATAPQALIDLINHDNHKHHENFIKIDYSLVSGKRWTGELLDNLVAGAPEGQRNDYLTRLCGQMLRTGADPQTVLELMIVANDYCSPPLPTNELYTIFNSILEREVSRRE